MARILYLHGSSVGPYGHKTEWLEGQGHRIVGRPTLPYPRHRRRSWRWGLAFLDRRWFWRSAAAAQEAYDCCRPEVIVASSMGGAVAMNLDTVQTPQVLVAPAWRAWTLFRVGRARTVKPATIILHGDADRTISLRYSRCLLASSPPSPADAALVALVERQLAWRLDRSGCRVEGRLIVLRGEGHRCNGPDAMQALSVAIEVLAGLTKAQAASGHQ